MRDRRNHGIARNRSGIAVKRTDGRDRHGIALIVVVHQAFPAFVDPSDSDAIPCDSGDLKN